MMAHPWEDIPEKMEIAEAHPDILIPTGIYAAVSYSSSGQR
jgi:hypothetical protein